MDRLQQGNNYLSNNYLYAQEYLASEIKQPQNLVDLKRNANLKFCQLELARAKGDLEMASILAYEYERILQDINNYYN